MKLESYDQTIDFVNENFIKSKNEAVALAKASFHSKGNTSVSIETLVDTISTSPKLLFTLNEAARNAERIRFLEANANKK